jgi:hypothetical protein
MESGWAAAFLAHPVPIGMALALVLIVTCALVPSNTSPPVLSRRQVMLGYLGVFVSCVIASAWGSYVSPQDATTIWKVPPENYWTATLNEFFVQFVLLSFVALVGCAVIGLPILLTLSRHALATVPWVLIVSVVVSLLVTLLLVLLDAPSPNARFGQMAPEFVGLHLLLSLGFCVGARLQWRLRQRS